jgi:hypothetical protein
MKREYLTGWMVFIVSIVALLLLSMPAIIPAQMEQANPAPPPIEQELASEGSFAVRLVSALGLEPTEDEVEAESRLGDLGITPRNGWVADYPLTPDIVIELQAAVSSAADAKRITLSREEALKRLNAAAAEFGMAVRPYTTGTTYAGGPPSCEGYPNPATVQQYYDEEGTPVVTYYCPPPAYYDLYAWVPCPFWWTGFWFPGFFILHDFHRIHHFHNKVVVITNHFNDIKTHRAFRIDPVARFGGKTFAGIGVPTTRGFISTGVPRSERTIFNGPSALKAPGRMVSPPAGGARMTAPPSRGGGASVPPSGGGRMGAPSGGGRMGAPSGGGRMGGPSGGGGGHR